MVKFQILLEVLFPGLMVTLQHPEYLQIRVQGLPPRGVLQMFTKEQLCILMQIGLQQCT